MHIIQSDIIIWLMGMEKRVHDWCTELVAVKHVNPYHYLQSAQMHSALG